MARHRIADILKTSHFHLLDVSFTLPPVLIPTWGFQGCTAPELAIEYKQIKEGNYEFPYKVAAKASCSTMTLTNGSQVLNSDFWDWISKIPDGRKPKKNLLVIHFTNVNPGTASGDGTAIPSVSAGGSLSNTGLAEFSFRIPGKAWLMKGCSPSRYKAGSDFDAMSGQPSIQELDIEIETFTEFNVGI